jgi:tellurite methyltransferase
VAELSCGHCQHVRHRLPFQLRAWVLDADGRSSRVGTPLGCPSCDRAELPDGLRLVRSTPQWTEHTMPVGLSRAHRVANGTWGRIVVHDGKLRFIARTEPELRVAVGPGSTQAIPPEVEHEVQPIGSVSFSIDFLSVDESKSAMVGDGGHGSDDSAAMGRHLSDEGGNPVCLAHLLCPDCGTFSMTECTATDVVRVQSSDLSCGGNSFISVQTGDPGSSVRKRKRVP